jgi:hypothetical protein
MEVKMTKVLLEIIQLNEKRMDFLKLFIFPTSLIYFSYFFVPSYLTNISKVMPDFKAIDSIYIVMYNTLKLANMISWWSLAGLFIISLFHYLIKKLINDAMLFDEVLFLRHRTIQRLIYWLTETSGWFTILIAVILIIKGPLAINTNNPLSPSDFFLIMPTVMFVIFWVGDWCITRKFGQELTE